MLDDNGIGHVISEGVNEFKSANFNWFILFLKISSSRGLFTVKNSKF